MGANGETDQAGTGRGVSGAHLSGVWCLAVESGSWCPAPAGGGPWAGDRARPGPAAPR